MFYSRVFEFVLNYFLVNLMHFLRFMDVFSDWMNIKLVICMVGLVRVFLSSNTDHASKKK